MTGAPTRADLDETFRLALLLEPNAGMIRIRDLMREHHPDMQLSHLYHLWEKYKGTERMLPTHSIETGERL